MRAKKVGAIDAKHLDRWKPRAQAPRA